MSTSCYLSCPILQITIPIRQSNVKLTTQCYRSPWLFCKTQKNPASHHEDRESIIHAQLTYVSLPAFIESSQFVQQLIGIAR